ncbi:MAG: hypothetical protein K0R17_3683 [Rariglobus sp.]|jgi:hypothetical protein|nr:hypothetical protein [Rariglobus sp.]
MDTIHPRLKMMLLAADAMAFAAEATARALKKARTKARGPRGIALHPGVDTPLWNELSSALRSLRWKYGEKANLARVLGLPRQRVDDFIVGRRRLPDAERTLLLLHWLAARQRGTHLS